MSQDGKTFKYLVARKNSFLVVSFVGALDNTMVGEMERCKSEIQEQNDIRALVLNFAEVSEIGYDIIPILTQIQQAARSRSIQIRLSALPAPLLDKLHRKGVVRRAELAGDLKEALMVLARGFESSVPMSLNKKAA